MVLDNVNVRTAENRPFSYRLNEVLHDSVAGRRPDFRNDGKLLRGPRFDGR
jgi:hypothetical protein